MNKADTGYRERSTIFARIQPDNDLEERIISRLHFMAKRRATFRIWSFGAGTMFALVALILSGRYLLGAFSQSGFYQYLSLLFSGDGVVYTYWRELSMSLIETMPVLGVTIVLVALATFIWSGVKTIVSAQRFALSV